MCRSGIPHQVPWFAPFCNQTPKVGLAAWIEKLADEFNFFDNLKKMK
jgi:hypothetical protein